MSQVLGKRLTYEQLTGKNESPHHETTGAREAWESMPKMWDDFIF